MTANDELIGRSVYHTPTVTRHMLLVLPDTDIRTAAEEPKKTVAKRGKIGQPIALRRSCLQSFLAVRARPCEFGLTACTRRASCAHPFTVAT